MASCKLDRESVSGSFSADGSDTVSLRYIVKLDSPSLDPVFVLQTAQQNGPNPCPQRRATYPLQPGAFYFANAHSVVPFSDSLSNWYVTVSFSPPPKGTDSGGQQQENPLLRPPIIDIEYNETEKVVTAAKNVQALPHGDGKGGNRAAGTLGPIVNAAGSRPDEPIVRPERLGIITIKRNLANIGAIYKVNRDYKDTTNSDTIEIFQARELAYEHTESLGFTSENGFDHYPVVTRIQIQDTTDYTIDNVGYDYWDLSDSQNPKKVRAKDSEGNFVADPINLKLDGDQGGDNTTTITFRDLEEKTYAGLFN